MFACQYKLTDVALKLIDKGCEIDFQDKNGNTALLWAAWHGCTEIVSKFAHVST